jgi:hypothetical protein
MARLISDSCVSVEIDHTSLQKHMISIRKITKNLGLMPSNILDHLRPPSRRIRFMCVWSALGWIFHCSIVGEAAPLSLSSSFDVCENFDN